MLVYNCLKLLNYINLIKYTRNPFMETFHDPRKQLRFLKQSLSQTKKPIGFFLSAGCPLAVKMSPDEYPLIPDVSGLTNSINNLLKSPDGNKNDYDALLEELTKSGKNSDNVEDILSFIRGLKDVSKGGEVRGFTEQKLIDLEKNICEKIVERMNVALPSKETPYHKLANWISSVDRDVPIEIFTTNYDLLMEQALEEIAVPYFDGFVGSRQPFFDLRAIEDNLAPKHWTRLWKIHGSINWYQQSNNEVCRLSFPNDRLFSHLIYPSHLKYDHSRKMPYLALIDQLNNFIRQNSSLLIVSGYSFNDEHLNNTIMSALISNPTSMVIALLFDCLTYIEAGSTEVKNRYQNALELGLKRANLSLWSYDEAIIGTIRGKWKPTADNIEIDENIAQAYEVSKRKKKDETGNETAEDEDFFLLKLGDFDKLCNFVQALIGIEKIRFDNEK